MKTLRKIVTAFLVVSVVAIGTSQAGPSVLGTAQDFAVLGASGVTNTGTTTLYGSLGVDPGSAISGFFGTDANEGPGLVTGGTVHQADAVAQQAQSDALFAYNDLKLLLGASDLSGTDLGDYHAGDLGALAPGIYKFTSSAAITGTLTLDFSSNPGGMFVFQIGSTLDTAAGNSVVNVIGGGPLSGVYWQVGTSATLNHDTTFAGNILADQTISLGDNANILCGRAIALTGAVTMIDNLISNNNTAEDFGSGRSDFGSFGFSGGNGTTVIPAPGAFLLVAIGIASLSVFRKRALILK